MLGRPTDSSQVVEEEGQSAQGGGDDDDDTGEEFLPPHQEKAEGAHGGPNLVQLDDFRHSIEKSSDLQEWCGRLEFPQVGLKVWSKDPQTTLRQHFFLDHLVTLTHHPTLHPPDSSVSPLLLSPPPI